MRQGRVIDAVFGVRGVVNDAVAVYVGTPTCAVAFVAR
jgi:hypothetical protein